MESCHASTIAMAGAILATTASLSGAQGPQLSSSWDAGVRSPDGEYQVCRIGTTPSYLVDGKCVEPTTGTRRSGRGDLVSVLSGPGYSWEPGAGSASSGVDAGEGNPTRSIVCAGKMGPKHLVGRHELKNNHHYCHIVYQQIGGFSSWGNATVEVSHILVRQPVFVVTPSQLAAELDSLKQDVLAQISSNVVEHSIKNLNEKQIEEIVNRKVHDAIADFQTRNQVPPPAEPPEKDEITISTKGGEVEITNQ